MRSAYIHANPLRDRDGSAAARVGEILRRHGVSAVDSPRTAELVISLGGDGTILSIAELAAGLDLPILGINLGNLGFMTAFDAKNLQHLDEVLEGKFLVDSRMMIRVSAGGESFDALNDAVLTGPAGRTLPVALTVSAKPAANIRGDGMIAATPTGSTAYSMSAGGPIADPRAECVILTPVCSHTPYARPIVIPADAPADIVCGGETTLTVDGSPKMTVGAYERVTIERSGKRLRLIRLNNYDFYDIMSKKLWNVGDCK